MSDRVTLSCSHPGCLTTRQVVGENPADGVPGDLTLIFERSGNWLRLKDRYYCPDHWPEDQKTSRDIGPWTETHLIKRLESETDLYYAVINRTDPAHIEEVFDQYTKILREVRSQAWKLGHACGKAGFDYVTNPYQDEEEA